MIKPLMVKGTVVWLIENTSLTFEQIAKFSTLDIEEIKAIADGDVAIGIQGVSPILNKQLTKEEISRCEKDKNAELKLSERFRLAMLTDAAKSEKGRKYIPIAIRSEKLNAIAWLVKNTTLEDSVIAKLIMSTKNTVESIRNKTHRHYNISIRPKDPVLLGICSQTSLNHALHKRQILQEKNDLLNLNTIDSNAGQHAINATLKSQQPIIVLLGPPGVGKGTQAMLLSQKYSLPFLSTGEMLRLYIAKNQNEISKNLSKILSIGELVDDEMMKNIVYDRLTDHDCYHGFIIDGYPRTLAQASKFANIIKELFNTSKFVIVNLKITEEELIRRLSGRFYCQSCKHVYNIISQPTIIANVCDNCGCTEFTQRDDDKKEIVENRIQIYKNQTQPLIDFYKNGTNFMQIDGTNQASNVFEHIDNYIKHYYIQNILN